MLFIFFSIKIFFTDTCSSQDSRGREGTTFYSNLPLQPAHEHSDIYLQLCMWDDYHIFLIATLVFTRLLLDEIYHLVELPFEWLIVNAMFVCLLHELILGFRYSDLTLETSRFELASTITLVLQANRLSVVVTPNIDCIFSISWYYGIWPQLPLPHIYLEIYFFCNFSCYLPTNRQIVLEYWN